MTRSRIQHTWLPVLAFVGFGGVTWPVWRRLWREWMSNDDYSHSILIVPIVLFLTLQRTRNDKCLAEAPARPGICGLALLAPSLLLYRSFLQNRTLYLAAFAMIGMIAGLIRSLAGLLVLRKLAFPAAYLALTIPTPDGDRITLPLAMVTGVCAGGGVPFLGLDVTNVGNSIMHGRSCPAHRRRRRPAIWRLPSTGCVPARRPQPISAPNRRRPAIGGRWSRSAAAG